MSFSEYFNAMSSLGQSIGQAALEPAQTRLKVSEYKKAEEAKSRLKEAALSSPVIRDPRLAAAQVDAGQSISGDLFKTQKTGGGGGVNNLNLTKMRNKMMYAILSSKHGEAMRDPVLFAKLAPNIQEDIRYYAALNGSEKMLKTIDQSFADLNTLAGSTMMGEKKLAETSQQIGEVAREVIAPKLKEEGYSDDEINKMLSDRLFTLDATRKMVLTNVDKNVAEQSIESFYSVKGDDLLKRESIFAQALGSLDSGGLLELSKDESLSLDKRELAKGMAVLKEQYEQIGPTESSKVLNDDLMWISNQMSSIANQKGSSLKERMIEAGKSYNPKASKARESSAQETTTVPAGISGWQPPKKITKDEYENLGLQDSLDKDEETQMIFMNE